MRPTQPPHLAALGLILTLGLPVWAAPTLDLGGVQRTEQAQWARTQLMPQPGHFRGAAPSGRLTGLILADGPHFTGAHPGFFQFHLSPSVPFPVRFAIRPTPAWPTQIWHLPTKNPRRPQTLHVASLRADLGHLARLPSWAHLVRADVPALPRIYNPGNVLLRAPKVLDGTPAFRVPVAAALTQLKARFQAEVSRQRPAAEAARAASRAAVPQGFKAREADLDTLSAWPTWDPATERLVVTFHLTRTRPWIGPAVPTVLGGPRCPCDNQGNCAPCADREPVVADVPQIAHVGFDLAARYAVDRRGRLIDEVIYLPQPTAGSPDR